MYIYIYVYVCMKIESARIWREKKKLITADIRVRYLNKWRNSIRELKQKLTDKNRSKVEWLRKKWKEPDRKKVFDNKGIRVEDDELGKEFESEPRLYGGIVMSENEMKILRLPPKFGLYRKLNVSQCKIDVEESLNKLRWNRVFRRDGNSQSNEGDNGEPVREGRDDNRFVSRSTKTVDIEKLKPSDLPFNPTVAMPPALSMEEEVKLFNLKTEVNKIAEDMASKSKKWSNLSKEEKNGLEELQRRVMRKEIVCTVTDKSGRWSCDTLDNYRESCEKLIEDVNKTQEIPIQEHDRAEQEMNSHALALTRMLGLSDGTSGNRLRQAVAKFIIFYSNSFVINYFLPVWFLKNGCLRLRKIE